MTQYERAKRRCAVLVKKGYNLITAQKKASLEFGVELI